MTAAPEPTAGETVFYRHRYSPVVLRTHLSSDGAVADFEARIAAGEVALCDELGLPEPADEWYR